MAADTPEGLIVGTIVCGKYEVLERIKPGGMAIVYRVRDTTSKRIFALKIALPTADEELARLAFTRECEALSDLHHRHIVELVDFGRTDAGQQFLLLEWLVGSLGNELASKKRWGWEDFYADVGRPLLTALVLAHTRDIAHRDIKPDNLMFGLLPVS